MRHRNVLTAVFVVSLVLLAAVTAMPVTASEHTVELQDGNTYWYGQLVEYNDTSVVSGENWELQGQASGNTLAKSAGQDGSVTFDPTNLAADSSNLQGEQVDLVNPSGTTVLTFTIDFQTLTPQPFDTDPVYNSGDNTTSSIDIDTNRGSSSYDLVITETSGKLTGSEIASLNSSFTQLNSTSAEFSNISGPSTVDLNFDGVAVDSYEFEFSTEHAVERDGAGGLQAVAGTQTINVEEAVGSISGSVSTEDGSYSNTIGLTLTEQGGAGEYTKNVSGPSSSYTFSNIPAGTYDLTLDAQRHQSVTVQDINVTNNSTASAPNTTLPLKDTIVDAAVDVNTNDGNTYDRQIDVALLDINGNIVGEKTINDETTATFQVNSTGDYTVRANDRFIEETTSNINVTDLGQTYNTTLNPPEQNRGQLEVTADTEGTVEEIRVQAVSASTDRSRTFRINGQSGTVTGELLTGDYEITVEALGHDSTTETVTISNGGTISKSYTLQETDVKGTDQGQYWVGQDIDFSQYVSSGDSVRFRNRDSNQVYQPAINDPSNFVVSTTDLRSAAGTGEFVFSVNGTPQVDFTLSEQNLSSSFTSDVQLDGDLETSLTISSDRTSEQTIVITKITTPDGTELNGSQAAELNGQLDTSGTKSFATVNSSEVFFNFDMSQAPFTLSEGDYVFTVQVEDTTASAESTLSVTKDTTTDVGDLVEDETIQNSGLYWTGQVLAVPSGDVDPKTKYRILKDETLVQELSPRSSDGKLIFDTSWDGYGAGDYTIENANGDVIVGGFLVRDQEFSAEFETNTVLNTGVQTEANVSFESNRSTYPVIVELEEGPQDLTASQIATRVASADIQEMEVNGETVPKAVIASADSSNERIEFNDLEEGTYNFKFDVMDSTASTTASIDVSGLEEGKPEFSNRNYSANQGDIAEFDVVMAPGVDETTLLIGNNDTGYYAELKLTDPQPNSATIATVKMDTTYAGRGEPDKTFSVASQAQDGNQQDGEGDNSTQSSSQVQIEIVQENEIETGGPLAPAKYLMQLETDGTERDISAFQVKELNAQMQGIHVIPQTTTLEELREKANSSGDDEENNNDTNNEEEEVQQTTQPFFGGADSVADGEVPEPDTGVVAIELNGLGSQLYQDGLDASDFEDGTPTVEDTGAYVTITQISDDEDNRADRDIPVSALDYRYNAESGYVYFLIQPSIIEEAQVGQTFEFELVIDERNPAIVEGEREPITVTREFKVTESAIDWGMDPLEVEPESGQPITAQTVYTPGTEMRMVMVSYETAYPYFQFADVEVEEDGRAIGNFDLNGAPLDTEMNVQLQNITEPHDVIVVDDAVRPSFAETVVPREATLTISLQDPEGNPVNGSVTVNGETKTGQDVDYTVDTETEVTVEANAEQYNSASQTVSIGENATKSTTLTLQPIETEEEEEEEEEPEEPQETVYNVSVTVIDESSGDPVEGATVAFGDRNRQTNGDGTATIELTEGTYTASINAEGYSGITQDVSISSDNSYELELTPEETSDSEGDGEGDSENQDNQNNNDGSSGETNNGGESGESGDDSVRTEGQSGFGVIIALIAVGAVFVARKVRK